MVFTGSSFSDRLLTESEIRIILRQGLDRANLHGRRLLIIIPDGTRSGPVDLSFRLFHELLGERAAAMDYLVALGTHMAMSTEAIYMRVGATAQEMEDGGRYANINIFSHECDKPNTFCTLGEILAS